MVMFSFKLRKKERAKKRAFSSSLFTQRNGSGTDADCDSGDGQTGMII